MQLGLTVAGRRIQLAKKNIIGQGTRRHHAYPNPPRESRQYMARHSLMACAFQKQCRGIRNYCRYRNPGAYLISNRLFLPGPHHQSLQPRRARIYRIGLQYGPADSTEPQKRSVGSAHD